MRGGGTHLCGLCVIFLQVLKGWEVVLETLRDGFFLFLLKNYRLGDFIRNSWRSLRLFPIEDPSGDLT